MTRFAILFALFAFVAAFGAELMFDGDKETIVLTNFGEGMATVTLMYKGPDAEIKVSDSKLFTVGTITSAEAAGGYTNYTIPLSFDKGVGSEDYTVTVGDASATGSVIAAGFVILNSSGDIVSGDEGLGVTVGQDGTTTYDVMAVGVDGNQVDISGTKLSFKEMKGPYMKEVEESKTSLTSSKFTLTIADFRVGTGSFMINFETDAIQLMGESFETVLTVNQTTEPEPPCVAIAGDLSVKDDYVMVPMFNLLVPPKKGAVKTVEITIGSDSATWDTSKSTLTLPDQVVAFKISASGKASLTCDGEAAVILGGDIDVTGDTELATDLIATLPSSDILSTFTAKITVVESDPGLLSKADGEAILNKFCDTLIDGSNCVIASITKGSAIMDVGGLIPEEEVTASDEALKASFAKPDCPFQTELGYACDGLKLSDSEAESSAADSSAIAASANGAVLATWTIVVIACVGAFALIVVIVLGLWAVYRRSADQSESDYSSSGPLGVPDPSDLLYEQSIVRDIYGRGDFPDGGPSQAVAEQRAREADLREEFPRPPSSSGLSRGAGTDDASSTYSV